MRHLQHLRRIKAAMYTSHPAHMSYLGDVMLKSPGTSQAVHLVIHVSGITLHSAHHVIETQHSINVDDGQSPVGEEQVHSHHKWR